MQPTQLIEPAESTQPNLNPAQREIVDRLGALGEQQRPRFDPDLRDRLRNRLEADLSGIAHRLDVDQPLIITKRTLAGVHSCEARWLAEEEAPFVPSVAVVRGTVVHKALELSVHWGADPVPLDLVDAAVDKLAASDLWLADYLATATAADLAELRGDAGEVVTKFFDTWPPLKPVWRPVTETTLRASFCDGAVKLRGVVDLTLGQPQGDRAGKVVVDLKTGGFAPAHIDDLRFYALLETLRCGIPPRLIASYYLDAGRLHPEAVTVELLEAAVARTADGIRRIVDLRGNLDHDRGRPEPIRRVSPACRWCPILGGCEPGQSFLGDTSDV